jgi:hypothetical protein
VWDYLSLLVPHKTEGEFMCSGKIAVLSLLVLNNTGDDFMCSGKIAVPSLLVLLKTGGESEKELLSFQNTSTHPCFVWE